MEDKVKLIYDKKSPIDDREIEEYLASDKLDLKVATDKEILDIWVD